MIKLKDISIDNIKNGKFESELPEFYELKNCIEVNPWHDNESVFDHSLDVLENLEIGYKQLNNSLKNYFEKIIDINLRKEIFFLSAMFHDIAKNDTLINENGKVYSPGHEQEGAIKVVSILDRFNLSEKEKEIIIDIIRNHGKIHQILSRDNDNIEKEIENLKKQYKEIFIDLVFLGYIDTIGADIKKTDKKEYDFRISNYKRLLSEL